jgi:hypothetical protein
MKILLVISLFLTTALAHATPEWWVKCYEKENQQEHHYNLAWQIGVNDVMSIWQCNDKNPDCEVRGILKKDHRQGETCLVSKGGGPAVDGFYFELCAQKQEHDHDLTNPHRLVPVTIETNNQESAAYCDRSILKLL